jgi:RNA polymerase sigma factor (sigma-70 family)
MGDGPPDLDALLRPLAPQVLGTLVRQHGQFDACEDALQEAMLAAATQWPGEGVPDNPKAWLITVANRRLTDVFRSESARRRREDTIAAMPVPEPEDAPEDDDTLTLMLLCCHPTLSTASQVALTLRAVGGLSTGQIASAFLVPEATMAQRISRAKATIKKAGATFTLPPPDEQDVRLSAVLHVLYLVFNEGYTASSGPALQRVELTAEAIRLGRLLRRLLPEDGEVTGLLALMVLIDARRDARTDADGRLVPLDEQDRAKWNQDMIAEGVGLISGALTGGPLGPYQVQAAIAAVHDEASVAETTDWRQILALYELLNRIAPSPVVTLNHAVALGMVKGPRAGLDLLTTVDELAEHHRLHAVRAHFLDQAGEHEQARGEYLKAAELTTSEPEQQYLRAKADRLSAGRPH